MADSFFVLILIVLGILAIFDLIVGVSNDAVNFLNSAIGSKVISFRNIMIISALGILAGVLFSDGIMEVARKGIFVPSEFYFDEIMIIFISVMITDILLLDFFNRISIPTSTTVSIVFELLGASVSVALVKVLNKGESLTSILNYINTSKASQIILGILLSVIIAFLVGALVQFIVRAILTFKFDNNPKYKGAVFGGLATTSILYFILIKGLKGFSLINDSLFTNWVKTNTFTILLVAFLVLTLLCWLFIKLFNNSIYKFIIIIGTFSLAMAFAGNDLVNFIGVPVAAWQSFKLWEASGLSAGVFDMSVLQGAIKTPIFILLASGIIMVITLWVSKKARSVVKTSLDLSDQNDIKERFNSTFLSRFIVKTVSFAGKWTSSIIPIRTKIYIDSRFEKSKINLPRVKSVERPAFDEVRAAVNLTLSSILISFATSMKLPLSTTYVTFMVAMGSSFSDRAWGVDSAVYRISGVINVIGSWFLTALIAFTSAAILAYLIQLGGETTISLLLLGVLLISVKNYLSYNKKLKSQKIEESLDYIESKTIQDIIKESSKNVSKVIHSSQKIYENAIKGISAKDLTLLKRSKKGVTKISHQVEELQNNIFYFIRNLDEPTLETSRFYILIIRYLQDITTSVEHVVKMTHKHVDNNHKGLTFSQINDINEVNSNVGNLLNDVKLLFQEKRFDSIDQIINSRAILTDFINTKIETQIIRTKSDESSPKNVKLYFSILLESRDFIDSVIKILQTYHHKH